MGGFLKRILIADDHEAIRQGVRSFIEQHAHWRVVAKATNGQDALTLARETTPDIAVLDYSLPLLNGLDLCRAIKRDLPRTEILIYTMHDREDVIFQILRAGAKGYVLKSETSKHLIAAIEALAINRPYFSGKISETLLERIMHLSEAETSFGTLTPREREIVQLIAEGNINKQIAALLNISIKTVETHRSAVMHKLNLRTTAELVRYAVRNNIVEA